MKIFIDNVVFAWQKSGGISVVWYELLKRLLNTQELEGKLYFIDYAGSEKNIFYRLLNIPSALICKRISSKLFGVMKYLPQIFSNKGQHFIFHSTYYRICPDKKAINIVTVHDFTYEYFCSGLKRYIHSLTKNYALRNADHIICISNNTKKDLLKFVEGVDESKVHVIYNGVSDDFFKFASSADRYSIKEQPYLVYVGSRASYKNFELAVRTSALVGMELMIVGDKLTEDECLVVDGYLRNNYKELGRIDNAKLNELYNKAFAFIYPSSYEGFGLPVIEAQKAGCPVLALDNSSITEIIGDKSQLVNEPKPEAFADQIYKLQQEDYRNVIVENGINNAKRFSWDETYRQYLLLYEDIMKCYDK